MKRSDEMQTFLGLEQLLNRLGDDKELAVEILLGFDDVLDILKSLPDAVSSNRYWVEGRAHALSGSFDSLGAEKARALARELQGKAIIGTAEECLCLIESLKTEVALLCGHFDCALCELGPKTFLQRLKELKQDNKGLRASLDAYKDRYISELTLRASEVNISTTFKRAKSVNLVDGATAEYTTEPGVPSRASRARDRRVILLDDNPIGQKLLARFLFKLDCEVLCFGFAEEALWHLRDHSYRCCDLMFINLEIEQISGSLLARLIRKEAVDLAVDFPIVGLTSEHFDAVQNGETESSVPIDRYIRKPISASDVASTIQLFFKVNRR